MSDAESPLSIFESYEHDFQNLIREIKSKLDGEGSNASSGSRLATEQRKAALRRVELELDEADDLLSQMQLTLQAIPKSIRTPYTTRHSNAKSELTRCKNRSRELHAAVSRSEVLGTSGGFGFGGSKGASSDSPYGNERQRLLAGTETLDDGSRRLMDSQRVALETEEQGADILRNLRVQREQIENSRNMLNTADVSIGRASGTLKKMIQQMYRQRVVISLIVVFLVAVVILILWFKLFRSR
ncbi:vesicle transport v-snare protein vti1 [Pleurotus eryngii]|uniref:Vesicle transport v-snare protein vti1 n=1 Tax=Pleurotus eryngii TaxID=5323 RepID=A0A9P6DC15_PLEER|nr:vesicle transport v-snare protein vti1 [Pleurotus eryngii]